MKPFFRTKDYYWPGIAVIIILWAICVTPLVVWSIWLLGEYRSIAQLSPIEAYKFSSNYGPSMFLAPIILFTFFAMAALPLMQVRLAAFEDRILVGPWLSKVHQFILHRENLVSIQASPEPAKRYFRVMRHGSYVIAAEEWRVLVFSGKHKGLMLQTKQRFYFVTCPDAEGAARILREAYNLPNTPIIPPNPSDASRFTPERIL